MAKKLFRPYAIVDGRAEEAMLAETADNEAEAMENCRQHTAHYAYPVVVTRAERIYDRNHPRDDDETTVD